MRRIALDGFWAVGRSGGSSIGRLGLILAISLVSLACGSAARIQSEKVIPIDLTDRFMPIAPVQPGNFDKHITVARKGQRRDAMVLVAPVAISASLRGASGKMRLEGLATQVFNIGDGIQMELFLVRGGTRQQLGSRCFDAARKAEDRDWIPIAFPLEGSEADNLEIRISGGSQGDLVADWLALSSLRLLYGEAGGVKP